MYCSQCGAPNADNAVFCSACGTRLSRQNNSENTIRIDNIPQSTTPVQAVSPDMQAPRSGKRRSNAPLLVIAIVLAVVLAALIGIYFLRPSSKPVAKTPEVEETTTDSRPEVKADYPGDLNNPDTRFQSFDWLSDRAVTLSDLAGLSKGDLRILRNAIFARHGYRFKSADLQEYFGRFSWYSPRYSDVTSSLSAIEQANIATIQRHEGGNTSSSTKSSGKAKLGNVGYADDYSDVVCYIYLDRSDLAGMTDNQLRILRNTIYARHGRRFKDATLQNYFNRMPWYSPSCNEVSPSALSAVEKHNIQLIQSLER